MISDLDGARKDTEAFFQVGMLKSDRELVSEYLNRKVRTQDKNAEAFSTHPNMIKRLRALQELA